MGVSPGMVTGVNTEAIAAEGLILFWWYGFAHSLYLSSDLHRSYRLGSHHIARWWNGARIRLVRYYVYSWPYSPKDNAVPQIIFR